MNDMELALAWKTQQGYTDCSTSLAEHDNQVIREFVEHLIEKMQKVHMDDNAWCEYHADEFIDEMENTAEEMLKEKKNE